MNRVHAWGRLHLRSALHRHALDTDGGTSTALAAREHHGVVAESLSELNAIYVDALNCFVEDDREDLADELSEQYLHDVVELLISER